MDVLDRLQRGEIDSSEANAVLLKDPAINVEERGYRFLVYDNGADTIVYDAECDRFTPVAEDERVDTLIYARREAEGWEEAQLETVSTYGLDGTSFQEYCALLRGTPGVVTDERDRRGRADTYRVAGTDTRIEVEQDRVRYRVEGSTAPDVSLPHALVADLPLEETRLIDRETGITIDIRYGDGPGGERIRWLEQVFRAGDDSPDQK